MNGFKYTVSDCVGKWSKTAARRDWQRDFGCRSSVVRLLPNAQGRGLVGKLLDLNSRPWCLKGMFIMFCESREEGIDHCLVSAPPAWTVNAATSQDERCVLLNRGYGNGAAMFQSVSWRRQDCPVVFVQFCTEFVVCTNSLVECGTVTPKFCWCLIYDVGCSFFRKKTSLNGFGL